MQGSVFKRGSTWSYRFYIGDGKRSQKGGFKTKGEASSALREAISEFEGVGFLPNKNITFQEYATQYLENFIKQKRKITTYNRYREILSRQIFPIIKTIKLSDLTPYHIELVIEQFSGKIAGSSLQLIYTLFNSIFKKAMRDKLMTNNPCAYVDRPKREKYKFEVLSVEEINDIFNSLNMHNTYDYIFSIIFALAVELGMRRGELCGLEWQDINFDENIIKINNNMVYSNGHVYMQTPKTDESKREIYVSDESLELLKQLRIRQLKNKLRYGANWINNVFDREYNLVFCWDNGHYVHPLFLTNKIKKCTQKVGVTKRIRFHDLRHTNATLLLEQDVDRKILQIRLGHKDYGTTMNIYPEVNKNMQKRATEKLRAALKEI